MLNYLKVFNIHPLSVCNILFTLYSVNTSSLFEFFNNNNNNNISVNLFFYIISISFISCNIIM